MFYLDQGGSAIGAYGKLDGMIRALVLGSWLASLGILVGIVLLVIPGLIIGARWSVLVPAIVLERQGAAAALGRSNEIVKGATGRVLAILAVVTLTGLIITLVPAVAAEIAAPGFVASLVYGLAFDVILLPLSITATYVVYRQQTQPPPIDDAGIYDRPTTDQ